MGSMLRKLICLRWAVFVVLLLPLLIRQVLQLIGVNVCYINPHFNFILWLISINLMLVVTSAIYMLVRRIGYGSSSNDLLIIFDVMQILLIVVFTNYFILFLKNIEFVGTGGFNPVNLPDWHLPLIGMISMIIFQLYFLFMNKIVAMKVLKNIFKCLVFNKKFKFKLSVLDLDRC